MTRVLIVGHIPLPFENLRKFYAPGARTWQFAEPLIADGHEVLIAGMRIPFVYDDGLPSVVERKERGCSVLSMTCEAAESPGVIMEAAREFKAECVVGAGCYPSYAAAISGLKLPFWADVYGSFLAEAQLKASVHDEDEYLEHYYRINHTVVMRADRFSTVALRQKYELIGELAFARRLSSSTAGYDFVSEIPSSYSDKPFTDEGARELEARTGGDFLILWSGGYNTWTDTRTLFEGLIYAMERDSVIRFVSTGGSIEGHDERSYPDFVSRVESSPHRDRFMLEGWIDHEKARSYYLACDVGINIDAVTYEVMLGSRTRILDWAMAGLPALSTNLCELTDELASKDLLFTFPPGDPEALGEALLELARRRDDLKTTGKRLEEYVLERFSNRAATSELRSWVAGPTHAPDWEERTELLFPPEPPPPITPDSNAYEKMRFYLKTEGLSSTVKRAFVFSRKNRLR